METLENDMKWFMQHQGQIQGPFDTAYLQSTLDRMDSGPLEQTLIWRRGFAEWLKASKFQLSEHTQTQTVSVTKSKPATVPGAKVSGPNEATAISSQNRPPLQKGPNEATSIFNQNLSAQNGFSEATVINQQNSTTKTPLQDPNANQGAFYKVQVNFVDQPLMSKNELLALIAKQEDVSVIAIQDPKSKEWKEVYAFPDIIEKLGISRRKDPRVPILAQFTGRTNRNPQFAARIITISEGGVGLTEVHELNIGDDVEGQMTSPHFFQPVNFRAEVVYAGLDGYIGLKFNQINEESKASIVDYIKKFGRIPSGQTQL